MMPISDEDNKKVQLGILSYFSQFCKENKLQYFLGYGSLIGAVRHNGFIPWDDDIDILMPRKDYNKLTGLFNKNKTDEKYELVHPLNKKARHPNVKIIDTRTVKIEKAIEYNLQDGYLGIDIDIFPVDGQPENEKEFRKWRKKLVHYYKGYTYCIRTFAQLGKREKVEKIVYSLLFKSKEEAYKKAQILHEMYPYENSRFVGVYESMYIYEGDRVPIECYEKSISHIFEGHYYDIPIGFDTILRNWYGDYLKLPPQNEQQKHHACNVFWK